MPDLKLTDPVLGLGRYLLGSGLRGGALLLLMSLVILLCARRSAGLRHLLWALALGQVGLLTALGGLLPQWHLRGLPVDPFRLVSFDGSDQGPQAVLGPGVVGRALPGTATTDPGAAAAPPVDGLGGGDLLLLLGVLVWVAGALWLLAGCVRSQLAARRLVREAEPVAAPTLLDAAGGIGQRLGLRRGIEVRVSPLLETPLVTGVWRPVLLLPTAAAGWPADRLEAVLAHELAHVRRQDCAVQLLAQLVRALHWMNPLCWLAVHRLMVERERACDDQVLGLGIRPSSYALHLLAVARQAVSGRRRVPAAAGAGAVGMLGCASLASRLERLLDAGRSHRVLPRRAVLLLAGAALALTAPAACLVGEPPGGSRGVRLVYQTDPRTMDETVSILGRRLDARGVEGFRIERQGSRLIVELPSPPNETPGASWKQSLSRPGKLRLVIVEQDERHARALAQAAAADPRARAAGIQPESDTIRRDEDGAIRIDRYLTGGRAALERYLAQLPPALVPEPGHRLVLAARDPGQGDRQRTLYLDERRSVSLTRFADARVVDDSRSPVERGFKVLITLHPEDGAALERLTGAHVGHQLALLMDDGQAWGAPTIQSAMGERVAVTARGGLDEGEQLAASFRAGALPAPLTLVAEEPLR